MRKNIFILFGFLSSLLSAGGGGGAHEFKGFNWWSLGSEYANAPAFGWYLITFFTFVFVLVYFTKKPLSEYLALRSQSIRNEIEEAKKAKEEAELRLKQYQDRLAQLDAEIDNLKKDFVEQGEKEKARIKEEAAALVERIKKDAKLSVESDMRHAKTVLKKDLLTWMLHDVENKLASGLNKKNSSELTNKFVGELS